MEVKLSLKLQSKAFKDGERIPDRYTCNGENISPEISWPKADPSVKSWALILDDPDAPMGIYTHWLIYNIPANVNELPENVPTTEKISNGALQGKNQENSTGYAGPCPPPGPVHHYNFNLYGLDSMLDIASGATKSKLLSAMKNHIVAQGKLIGIFQAT